MAGTSDEMDILEKHCYRYTFNMYFLFAALPGRCPLYRLAARTYILCYLFCSSIVEGAGLFVGEVNMGVITDNIPPTSATIYMFFQAVIASLSSRSHGKIVQMMEDDLKEWRSEEENVIKKEFLKNTRTLLVIYSSTIFVAWLVVFVSEMLPDILDLVLPLNESRPRKLLFQAVYPVDEEEYYYVILVLQDIGASIVLYILVTTQNMFTLSVHHVCYMFAVVGHRLENLTRFDEGVPVSRTDYDRIIAQRIKICVEGHWKAIKFALLIQSHTDLALFLYVILVIISISVSLLEATNLELLTVRTTCFTIGQLGQFFLVSILGQKQIDESMNLMHKVYNAEWYNFPANLQKSFVVMIIRCCKPCEQVVKKLYALSLRNYVSIVHTCISFYMVLREFQ